ncbi:DUF1415 domain-containing protein [Neptuniibacter caesariensis]|uniref:DUF1415 domain-containing protein n=1 Tax=Neptuniibacter caesariensis TaxID=207954 RepID=A0A7U8GSI4_NEPCE|nr:DUF1415 domain-containing protein [Neptuniibacter caesariensis]EAR62517.1 hypothetical protein MED92_05348 [Oceanospirillum sp. MED92] [Neptuniibacter caesariensis]
MTKQLFAFPAEQAASLTQQWVEAMVVGLNLCPFAAPEVRNETIRYAVSGAEAVEPAVQDFLQELAHIQGQEESDLSTTLVSFTQTAQTFEEFLDLLDLCQAVLENAGLDGIFQLASFHPEYCFAGVDADDITNWTNRAPFPTIHIIREGQMSRVLVHYKNPEEIPERNMALMDKLGREGLIERFPPLADYWPQV